MPTKPSTTLRYLEGHAVFTLDEYLAGVDPDAAPTTRYANLRNAVARGQARRLTRGLYASNIGVYRDRTPYVALVASKAASDSVLSHHTALEVLGVAHSVLRDVPFTSNHRVKPFVVDDYRFTRVPIPRALMTAGAAAVGTRMVRSADELVRVTTPERTVVDCLMRQDLAGGLEEMLRSAGGFPNLAADQVVEYVETLRSSTAAARAGWLLEMGTSEWHVSPEALVRLRRLVKSGPHMLLTGRATDQADFVALWRLYVPRGLPYAEWLRS